MDPSPQSPPLFTLLDSPAWREYELLDSGAGLKLERYGDYTFVRPEPQALWRQALPAKRWQAAHGIFHPTAEESGGHWQLVHRMPESWPVHYKELAFRLELTAGRHLGLFPEQAAHWDWLAEITRKAARPLNALNLFGYTGAATLALAQAGAKVTHVDASKKSVSWARQNQALSGLEDRPVRWIVDDALKFVLREGRRGVCYDILLLDPPKFGRGPQGEVWEFFERMPELLAACKAVFSEQPVGIVITAYAIRLSALSLHAALSEMTTNLGGEITCGELVLRERSAGRLISTAIFGRWER